MKAVHPVDDTAEAHHILMEMNETKRVVCIKYKDVHTPSRIWCSCGGQRANTVLNIKASKYDCTWLCNANVGKGRFCRRDHSEGDHK